MPLLILVISTVKLFASLALKGLSRSFEKKKGIVLIKEERKKVFCVGIFTYSKGDFLVNKDCACEIRCRVSFAVLSESSAVLALPQLLGIDNNNQNVFFTLAFPGDGFVGS